MTVVRGRHLSRRQQPSRWERAVLVSLAGLIVLGALWITRSPEAVAAVIGSLVLLLVALGVCTVNTRGTDGPGTGGDEKAS